MIRFLPHPHPSVSSITDTQEDCDGISKLLGSPGIDSKESIPPGYIGWRAGTTRFLAPHRLF
jgi:hypothetical protein